MNKPEISIAGKYPLIRFFITREFLVAGKTFNLSFVVKPSNQIDWFIKGL